MPRSKPKPSPSHHPQNISKQIWYYEYRGKLEIIFNPKNGRFPPSQDPLETTNRICQTLPTGGVCMPLSEKAKLLGDQPAFPFVIPATLVPAYLADDATAKTMYLPGLTIRQEFARTAMQGLLACPLGTDADEIPKNSVYWADRLLEELAKGDA